MQLVIKTFFLFISLFCLASCSSHRSDVVLISEKPELAPFEYKEISTYPGITLSEQIGDDIGLFGYHDGLLYYSEKNEDNKNGLCHCRSTIKSLSTNDLSIREIISLEGSEETAFWMCEETLTGYGLAWDIIDKNGTSVFFLPFGENHPKMIANYGSAWEDACILLNADDRFLVWISWENDQKSGHINIYDPIKEETKILPFDISCTSPFSRITITNGLFAYSIKDGEIYQIFLYDVLNQESTHVLDLNFYPYNLSGNKDYLVWSDSESSVMRNIYCFSIKKNKLYTVCSSEEDIDAFSFHLYENKILINDRSSKKIICRNMSDFSQSNFTDDGLYILGKFSANIFSALDCSKGISAIVFAP